MAISTNYDVIIIGGSYVGLQAAMTLGRALRNVLVIDSGEPCNRQTPYSHNFLTRDGETPAALAVIAKEQLKAYTTVSFFQDKAVYGMVYNNGFEIGTLTGKSFTANKLLFAAGIKDVMPEIKGFAQCWGISILHCPYCHGYEVRNQPTGILSNGDIGYELVKLINNWTNNLTLYTNGPSELTAIQLQKLKAKNINVIATEIQEVIHENGQIKSLLFTDGSSEEIGALYTRLPFHQHCFIPQQLGCELTELGLIKADGFGKTAMPGVYVAGDCASPMRSVANAVAMGSAAAAFINKEMIDTDF